ncbi:RICIN domain-containing protein [Micromonospora chokoriensis]
MRPNSFARAFAAAALLVIAMVAIPSSASAAPTGLVPFRHGGPGWDSVAGQAFLNIYKSPRPGAMMVVTSVSNYKITDRGNGFDIVNQKYGACLDANQTEVYGLGCNGGNFQRWNVTGAGNGFWRIQNRATGKCLDSDARRVYMLSCNGGLNQRWRFSDPE